jgi:hypothetical protein
MCLAAIVECGRTRDRSYLVVLRRAAESFGEPHRPPRAEGRITEATVWATTPFALEPPGAHVRQSRLNSETTGLRGDL